MRFHYLTLSFLLSLLIVLVGSPAAQAQTIFADGFVRPYGIIQIDDGRVLVVAENEVVAFQADGTGRTNLPIDFSPRGDIAQLQDGRVLATSIDGVVAFDVDGTGGSTFIAGGFSSPYGITQLQDGRIVVLDRTDQFESQVIVFNADGSERDVWATVEPSLALTQLADGRILVDGLYSSVIAFNTNGSGPTTFAPIDPSYGILYGICQLSDGRILIATLSGHVLALDTSGQALPDFASGLDNPYGITQLQDGRVLVTEIAAGTIRAYDSAPPTTNEPGTELPTPLSFDKAYPNPFQDGTTVAYALPEAGSVRVEVYDLLGREVAILVDGTQAAGRHEVPFNAGDLPSGVYVVRLESGGGIATTRLTLMR